MHSAAVSEDVQRTNLETTEAFRMTRSKSTLVILVSDTLSSDLMEFDSSEVRAGCFSQKVLYFLSLYLKGELRYF